MQINNEKSTNNQVDNKIVTNHFWRTKLGNTKYFFLKTVRFLTSMGRLFKSCVMLYFEQWKRALSAIGSVLIGRGCQDYPFVLRILASMNMFVLLVFVRACPILIMLYIYTNMFPVAALIVFAIVALIDFSQIIFFGYNRCPDREYEGYYFACDNPECKNDNGRAYYSEVSGSNITIYLNDIHFHSCQVDNSHRVDKSVIYNQIAQVELKESNMIPHLDYKNCRVKAGISTID